MKPIDLKSTFVAGILGAGLSVLWYYLSAPPGAATGTFPSSAALQGFVTGAGVQMGVRLVGVS